MAFRIVLRLKVNGQLAAYYVEHDPRTRWTTDPKRALEFSVKEYAETIAEALRQSETNRAYLISVE
jgi:hypothetical protein